MSHRSTRPVVAVLVAAALVAPLGLAAAPGRAGATGTRSDPEIRVRSVSLHAGTTSSNWSGYGIAGAFSRVTGSWTVPTASPSAGTTYSSTWIGVDGMANRQLLQVGTESDYVNGSVHYDSWWEVLPAAERTIPTVPVHPGDRLSASITHVSGRKWTVVLTDLTTGSSFTRTRSYAGVGTSAEWIEERPQIGRALTTLTPYGSTTFSGLTVNGVNPHLAPVNAISMVGNLGTPVISAPSAPSPLGDAFSVAYGASAPPPPAG